VPIPVAAPVVAAVDGPAVGMGAEFATQCDVRIASTTARFAWNFVHRGLVPDTAGDALALGFVSAVVEPGDVVQAACTEARGLSRGSPLAGRLVKELMYAGLERGIAEHLEHNREALATCFASEDHREGVAAFLERREARFAGR
jgi:2-(1,2-epoxy-1,2-dihydrophenyl)acetyl-CoA isomerase